MVKTGPEDSVAEVSTMIRQIFELSWRGTLSREQLKDSEGKKIKQKLMGMKRQIRILKFGPKMRNTI